MAPIAAHKSRGRVWPTPPLGLRNCAQENRPRVAVGSSFAGPIPRRLPLGSDPAACARWAVAHLRTAWCAITAEYAIPHSRPTGTKKCLPALDPPCDDESAEPIGPLLSYCDRHAPPAPDSCSCAPCLRPTTARQLRWFESCKSHPTSPLAQWTLRAVSSGSFPLRCYRRSVCPSCNAPAPSQS